jgi:hypothetical protein
MQDEIINQELNNLINEETTLQTDATSIRSSNMPNQRQDNELEQGPVEPSTSIDTSKTERRGRHKKDCICDKCQAKKGDTTSENFSTTGETLPTSSTIQVGTTNSKITNSNPLDLSEFKKTELSGTSPNETEVNAVKYITGSLMLMLIDAVAPTLIIKVLGMTNDKFKKIPSKKVRLSKDQKEDLEPLANEAVKQMTINMNPMTAFFMCTSLIYATNIMSAVED